MVDMAGHRQQGWVKKACADYCRDIDQYSSWRRASMKYNGFKCVVIAMLLLSIQVQGGDDRGAVSCGDLRWSEAVLQANPDIAKACRGVFQKDGVLYALAKIEVVQVQGNTLRFRTLRTDGSKGPRRSVKLPGSFRVNLDGRDYRISELSVGQQLDIFLPEDRFALVVSGDSGQAQVSTPVDIED